MSRTIKYAILATLAGAVAQLAAVVGYYRRGVAPDFLGHLIVFYVAWVAGDLLGRYLGGRYGVVYPPPLEYLFWLISDLRFSVPLALALAYVALLYPALTTGFAGQLLFGGFPAAVIWGVHMFRVEAAQQAENRATRASSSPL